MAWKKEIFAVSAVKIWWKNEMDNSSVHKRAVIDEDIRCLSVLVHFLICGVLIFREKVIRANCSQQFCLLLTRALYGSTADSSDSLSGQVRAQGRFRIRSIKNQRNIASIILICCAEPGEIVAVAVQMRISPVDGTASRRQIRFSSFFKTLTSFFLSFFLFFSFFHFLIHFFFHFFFLSFLFFFSFSLFIFFIFHFSFFIFYFFPFFSFFHSWINRYSFTVDSDNNTKHSHNFCPFLQTTFRMTHYVFYISLCKRKEKKTLLVHFTVPYKCRVDLFHYEKDWRVTYSCFRMGFCFFW